MSEGDLKDFLRLHLCQEQLLLQFSRDVCAGMAFLASSQFVHRDLAARNCLLHKREDGSMVVKIADFGFAKAAVYRDYYRMQGAALLPVRWMALESLREGKFTVESDVCTYLRIISIAPSMSKPPCTPAYTSCRPPCRPASPCNGTLPLHLHGHPPASSAAARHAALMPRTGALGITLWEIFSRAEIPYPAMDNQEVFQYICDGQRLPKPKNCPAALYTVSRSSSTATGLWLARDMPLYHCAPGC